jgi:hypothetical protein
MSYHDPCVGGEGGDGCATWMQGVGLMMMMLLLLLLEGGDRLGFPLYLYLYVYRSAYCYMHTQTGMYIEEGD